MDHTNGTDVALSGIDLRDMQLIVDASLDSDPIIRDVSDDDTRDLSARLAGLRANASNATTVRLCRTDARDLASIALSISVQGAVCFPVLAEHEITDDRLAELYDAISKAVDPC